MPHSPVTRILALLLVVLSALSPWIAEKSPGAGLLLQGIQLGLLAIFTGTVVRSASPFDERAFHLTLPDGRKSAFRRVLALHAVVFASLLLPIVVCAVSSNTRWPDLVHGILAYGLALTAFCAAVGTVVTLGTTGRTRGILAFIFAVLLGAGSWYLLFGVHSPEGLGWDWPQGRYYLSGVRCAWVLGALGYFFTWCWVTMRQGKRGGFLGLVLTGVLLPWIGTYANFIPVPDAYLASPTFELSVTRKALPETAKESAKVTDMLELSGLEEGEFSMLRNFDLVDGKGDSQDCAFAEVRKGSGPPERTLGARDPRQQGYTWFAKSGGQILWGSENIIWKHLEGLLPPHETSGYLSAFGWHSAGDWPETDAICYTGSHLNYRWRPGTEFALSSSTWKFSLSTGTTRWEILGACKPASGADLRLPQGGILSVQPFEEKRGDVVIRVAYRPPTFGPVSEWFGGSVRFADIYNCRLMLVDETGKRSFVLGGLKPEPVSYGITGLPATWSWVWVGKDPENVLRRGTLYLFHPVLSRFHHSANLELPPP